MSGSPGGASSPTASWSTSTFRRCWRQARQWRERIAARRGVLHERTRRQRQCQAETRQVRRARQSLVGSERPAAAAARTQSGAPGLHRRSRAAGRRARARRRLRRRPAQRGAGARGREGHRARPGAGAGRGREAAPARVRPRAWTTGCSRSSRWPAEVPGAFDVVTCMEMLEHVPDPGIGHRRLRDAAQAGRASCSCRPSTARRWRSPSPSSAPNTWRACCRRAPTSTASFIKPSELAALAARGRAAAGGCQRPGLRPDPAQGLGRPAHRHQLPGLRGEGREPGWHRRRWCCSTSTAPWSTAPPTCSMRSMSSRRARARRQLPLAAIRAGGVQGRRGRCSPWRSPNAIAVQRELLLQPFLDVYAEAVATHSTPFEGVAEVLDAIEAAGSRWGIVTNKPDYLAAAWLPAWAGPSAAPS